jgi:dihydrofolate synthase/folylpolyglutamate synthase
VIYDGRNPEAEQVILETAARMHAPAWRYDDTMREITGKTDKSIDFILDSQYDKTQAATPVTDLFQRLKVTVPYLAEYQIVNSTLALATLRVIDPDRSVSDEQAIEGIATTTWQGRMETVMQDVVLDGAHNADGIREFIRTVQSVEERRSVSLLFSAVVEKEYEKMIRTICESIHPVSIVVTQVGGARVVPAGQLAEVFARYTDVPVIAKADVQEAFETALARRGDSMLFCAGSLYLVGEIKAVLRQKKAGTTDRNA